MTPAEIKLRRTESVLKELIPEAISLLNDKRLHLLDVIDIRCSKGRDDAKVYLDPSLFDEQEQQQMIQLIHKARATIQEHCAHEQGWFRSPKLTFVFDDSFEKSQNIERLFAKIAKEKKGE